MLHAARCPLNRAAKLPPELQFCNAYPPEGCTDSQAGGGACYGGRHARIGCEAVRWLASVFATVRLRYGLAC